MAIGVSLPAASPSISGGPELGVSPAIALIHVVAQGLQLGITTARDTHPGRTI